MRSKHFIRGGATLLILIVLATGCGNSITTPPSTSTSISIPSHTGSPIISMDISHVMQGKFSHLAIYEDGYIIRNEESGLRFPSPEHPPTRNWYTSQLSEEEVTSLIDFFRNSGFMDMNKTYVFAGKPDNGAIVKGDNSVTIAINYADLQKTVSASAYLEYADMPYPLNEIYDRLWSIALETIYVT